MDNNSIVKPITPEEVRKNRINYIHPDVITIVNDLLSQRFTETGTITIKQDEILKEFFIKNPTFERNKFFSENHLNFEEVYRPAGWSVKYDRPAYNESYDPYFVFSVKK